MRGSLSLLVVVAALAPALPAAAQPSAAPQVIYIGGYAQPTYYYPDYAPAPAAPAPPRRPRGIYFSESFGGMNVSDELRSHMDGGLRVRAALGYRRDQLAFELWAAAGIGFSSHDRRLARYEGYLSLDTTQPTRDDYHQHAGTDDIAMVGVDVKYIKTLSRHFEVYAKGGLSRAYAGSIGSGPGLGLGGGAQLKGKVPVIGFLFWPLFFTGVGPKVTAAVFTETGYEFYRLHGIGRSTDASITSWTFGFAVGSDF